MIFHRLKVCTLALFFALSALDLALTLVILRLGGADFRESNPMAGWALEQAGWLGLTSFKTGSVLAVTACCFAIATWRPRLGNYILSFACVSLLAVVGYSSALAGTSGIFCPHAREHDREIEQRSLAIQRKLAEAQGYALLYRRLWNEMLAGRMQIPEAAAVLTRHAETHQTDWVPMLRQRYHNSPLQVCLEQHLRDCLKTALGERFPLLEW
jgi:Domain of unknown function (DUF5658)